MKRFVITILAFSSLLSSIVGQKELTTNPVLIFGELRLDNKPFPWEDFQLVEYDMKLIKERHEDIKIENEVEVHLYAKEKYYPQVGTEFLISSKKELPGTFFLRGGYIVTLKGKDTIRITDHIIPIDITDAKEINKNTQKLSHSIEISAPEKLSLVVMINYINRKLHKESLQEGGFSKTLAELDNYKAKYLQQSDKKINYETLMNFYSVLSFIEYYIDKNSFFLEEAEKLNQNISDLSDLIKNRREMRQMDESRKDSLNNDLITSNQVYSAFQETYKEIEKYYTELQLILFSYNCGVYGGKNFQQKKEKKKKWRTDLSVGLAFSFGDNTQDQQLFFQSTDVGFDLQERDNNDFISPSISTLIIHSLNTEKQLSFGFNYGVGANFQTIFDRINLGLFIGASMFIGRSRAITVNSGLSMLAVRRLDSPTFNIGDIFQFQFNTDSITEKVFKSSPYISITYNLTQRD